MKIIECIQNASPFSCLATNAPLWVWPLLAVGAMAALKYFKFVSLRQRFEKECDGGDLYYEKDGRPREYPRFKFAKTALFGGKIVGVKIQIPAGKTLKDIAARCEGLSRVFGIKLGAPVEEKGWAYIPRATWEEEDVKKN